MDKIYKTINIGNSISRRNGLLPFVDYNSHEIKNVSDINGNYGHYVCDFGIFSEDEEGVIKEKARLKYLDVIRWYRFIDECLKKSVYVKKVIVEEEKLTKIKCDENESKNNRKKETIKKFYENFKGKNKLNRIDYTALDASFFKSDGNAYIFEYPNDYFLIEEKKDSELTIEEKELKERVDKQVNIFNKDKNNFVLLQNYDSVMHFNNVWKEWWETNFPVKDWEKKVFSGYEEYGGDFKFCYDIERYVLGKIETSNLNLNDIDEDKIPPYIYYIQLLDSDEGLFNDFLSKIEPSLWQSQKQVKDDENGLIFTYIAPVFDIPTIINSEYDSETMYDIYEYNIVKNEKEGAIKQYIPNGNLKKQWFDLSETPIKCESQLRTMQHPGAMMITDEIFGLYECFDVKNPENGALFKCTYCSGTTVEPLIEVSHNATIENMGIIDAISYDTIVITEKAPTPKNEERFIVGVKEIGRNVEYKTDSEKIVSYYEDNSVIEENKITTTNYYTSAITHIHYGWWECEEIPNNNDDIKCGDDEIIESGEKKYRNVVILSCIDNVIKDPLVGSYYYFLARYKNGNFSPTTIVDNGTIFSVGIPYKENIELNKTVYDDGTISYDTIIKKEINSVVNEDGEEIGNTITITYAKGVTSGESVNNSGILYRETFNYYPNKKEIVAIDGSYMAELYYDQIDTLTSNVIVYSEEYKLTRYTNRAEIIGLEVGTQWTEEGAIDAFLITKDGSENLSEEPKYDINLTYNRGNAAAWENHFKLSECNTMEDLKNYGNNYFNI